MTDQLAATAAAMVERGKGILAADESIGTMSDRLQQVGVEPTEENRRAYREMLVTTPDLSNGVSGVILCEETLRQSVADGRPFPEAMQALGLLPGIKVDTGARPLAGAPGETVTEGLDGLRGRLSEFAALGARFAKWRAVIVIGENLPSARARHANAHALARYAALCQEAGIVPIVEPEVMMTGAHSMSDCAAVTAETLAEVFAELRIAGVRLDGMVLKPNMVVPGKDSGETPGPEEVAAATVGVLRDTVPASVAGIAFLSGGQSASAASANLDAMQKLPAPWPLTFSFGRALVAPALEAWAGKAELWETGQRVLAHRVGCNTAALAGNYSEALESAAA
ncbi:class I fructose-bisphosphate aldolase [Streptomyces caeni]|uniref:fructose-bisphosphate aldolase n=1 Tax=Streptomyces caeni TaxID=2307231 RepID=A0ABW4IYC6_9ACTN